MDTQKKKNISKTKSALKFQYGLTLEQYHRMIEKQDNCCAICGRSAAGQKKLHIDHDHNTGKVRELLCGNCNLFIGLAKEDPKILQSAIDYINKHFVHEGELLSKSTW